ncbi:MAG TPA: hypothetical protein VFT22_31105 [Kofleriaceae bacterium]|nr:hypothetical protein [Kofleriaceae bacterium]
MRKSYKIKKALEGLTEDPWRKGNSFSHDMEVVHKILFHPYSSDRACAEALANWLQRAETPPGQPCLFGRIAAARNSKNPDKGQDAIHYCFLYHDDLRESDQDIHERIKDAVLTWKRRALDPARSKTAHGFMLCAISERIVWAAPDSNLLALGKELEKLWGCPIEDGLTKETLYLRNPDDGTYVRFTFTVDFFAAQGDKRWWHDHRIPGGIAFTANSIGHMFRHRQWYRRMKPDQIEWIVRTAMQTIDEAADVGFGVASRLIALSSSGPVAGAQCPFKDLGALPKELQGKDWSRYSGWHHSDHCIRSDFFGPGADVPDSLREKPAWYQDFGYLYDANNSEHARFVTGEPCTQREVDEKLGRREEWPTNYEPVGKRLVHLDAADDALEQRMAEAQLEIEGYLNETRKWALSEAECVNIDGSGDVTE